MLGRKEYGRLGLGENCDDATEPTLIPALQDKKVINISCGSCVSFAVTEEGMFSKNKLRVKKTGSLSNCKHFIINCFPIMKFRHSFLDVFMKFRHPEIKGVLHQIFFVQKIR